MTKADLQDCLNELSRAPDDDDAVFHHLVERALKLSDTSDADFAELVRVSRPTATRWRGGRSVPHPALRPSVYIVLTKRLEHALRLVEQHVRGGASSSGERLVAKSGR